MNTGAPESGPAVGGASSTPVDLGPTWPRSPEAAPRPNGTQPLPGVRQLALRARARATLALSAVRSADGNLGAARRYAREAAQACELAGLTAERRLAIRALDALSRPSGAVLSLSQRSIAVAMREYAARWAEQFGQDSEPSSSPIDEPPTTTNILIIDLARDLVTRNGIVVASLRRRWRLKRLLSLLVAAPRTAFSKQGIVEAVWEVDYHPLRHDPPLHTSISRIRKLLGPDGAELVQLREPGYRFVPPPGFQLIDEEGCMQAGDVVTGNAPPEVRDSDSAKRPFAPSADLHAVAHDSARVGQRQ